MHKIQVRLGDAEFSAEGSEDAVKEQYGQFLELVRGRVAAPPRQPTSTALAAAAAQPPASVDALTDRVFDRDKAGKVSLKALPTGASRDADALVLLLYGYRKLLDVHAIVGSQLLRAARQSGLQIDRVDIPLAVRAEFITTAGARRGKRYGLNNRGVAYAEDLLARVVE